MAGLSRVGVVAVLVLVVLLVVCQLVVAVMVGEQNTKCEPRRRLHGDHRMYFQNWIKCSFAFLNLQEEARPFILSTTAMAHRGDDFEDDFVPDDLVALSDDGGDAIYESQSSDEAAVNVASASTSTLPSITPEAAKAAKKRKRRQKEKETKAKVSSSRQHTPRSRAYRTRQLELEKATCRFIRCPGSCVDCIQPARNPCRPPGRIASQSIHGPVGN